MQKKKMKDKKNLKSNNNQNQKIKNLKQFLTKMKLKSIALKFIFQEQIVNQLTMNYFPKIISKIKMHIIII